MYSYEKIVGQFANQMLKLMPGHIPPNFQETLNRLYTYLHEHIDSATVIKTNLTNLLNDFIIKNCSDWQINMNPNINVNVNLMRDDNIGLKIVNAIEQQDG